MYLPYKESKPRRIWPWIIGLVIITPMVIGLGYLNLLYQDALYRAEASYLYKNYADASKILQEWYVLGPEGKDILHKSQVLKEVSVWPMDFRKLPHIIDLIQENTQNYAMEDTFFVNRLQYYLGEIAAYLNVSRAELREIALLNGAERHEKIMSLALITHTTNMDGRGWFALNSQQKIEAVRITMKVLEDNGDNVQMHFLPVIAELDEHYGNGDYYIDQPLINAVRSLVVP